MATTTRTRLSRLVPVSETHWRSIAAAAHRSRGYPGDESAARTHENEVYSIRTCGAAGTSRGLRLCPRCVGRGVRVALLFMGGADRCGNCLWPGVRT
jgi:hypothetical protein